MLLIFEQSLHLDNFMDFTLILNVKISEWVLDDANDANPTIYKHGML
jgi:hypothetical protein